MHGLLRIPWSELAHWQRALVSLALIIAAVIVGAAANGSLFFFIRRFAARANREFFESFARHCKGPARLIVVTLAIDLVMPSTSIPAPHKETLRHALALLTIGAHSWLLISIMAVIEDVIRSKYPVTAADNYRGRRIYTQLHVFRRAGTTVIIILTVAVMLTTFPWARTIGTSILASAGIAGLAFGLAARPLLENMVAGLQIAITQPFRLEDVVIVEGQWGWIEEITTTYVVVRIWNLQRLVLPISYFTQKAFQNWTRQSSELMGTIHVFADYTIPVQAVRDELQRICSASPLWDGKVCVVQVTHATEHTINMRALVSAKDSGTLWNFRCEVREKLIDFIRQHYPRCLPRTRAVLEGVDALQIPEDSGRAGTGTLQG